MRHFTIPRTPESRTPYVLALLAAIGTGRFVWNAWHRSPYSIAILLTVATSAIAYAVYRYLSQPPCGRRSV